MNHYSDIHTDNLCNVRASECISPYELRAAVAAYIIAVQALQAIAATGNITHARDYANAALAAMKRGA